MPKWLKVFLLLIWFSSIGSTQENWDTTYYVSCKSRLSLGLVVSERSYNIDIKPDAGSATTIRYDTEARNAVGFVADFDKLAIKALFKKKNDSTQKRQYAQQ